MGALAEVKNLVKIYKAGEVEVRALRGVTLTIEPGDFLAIMGASGSGKSTFMNILGCLDLPTSGEYFLENENVFRLDKNQLAELRNKKVGFIFQSFNILARTTAIENVELPLLYDKRVGSRERKERAILALRSVNLENRMFSMPNQLSGGEQQRVAIARALVNNPRIILADEPTGNLDSRTSYEIMEIFQKLNDQGITIVMVTHEPDISKFAKQMILFKDGRIIARNPINNRKYAMEELKGMPAPHEEEQV
jgi:putative ABC transport system ATP-binding protein